MEEVTEMKQKADHYIHVFEDDTIVDSFVSELDIDSPFIGTFNQIDKHWLEHLVSYVYKRTPAQNIEKLVAKLLEKRNFRKLDASIIHQAKATKADDSW